jgi:hypothetical protein
MGVIYIILCMWGLVRFFLSYMRIVEVTLRVYCSQFYRVSIIFSKALLGTDPPQIVHYLRPGGRVFLMYVSSVRPHLKSGHPDLRKSISTYYCAAGPPMWSARFLHSILMLILSLLSSLYSFPSTPHIYSSSTTRIDGLMRSGSMRFLNDFF